MLLYAGCAIIVLESGKRRQNRPALARAEQKSQEKVGENNSYHGFLDAVKTWGNESRCFINKTATDGSKK